MAKRIQGITIEIDGNTTKLNDALKDTSKIISSTNTELRDLNKALKLDPTNTELLAQKQDVLKKNIEATKDKLEMLKEAQRQMGSYNSLTEEQKENYRALSVEIAKSESALKGMTTELQKSSKVDISKLKDGLKKVGDVAVDVAKKMAQVTAAISGALAGVVAAGVKSFADLQQNIGGVETLFGDAADKVKENAAKAFETAGVSANEYMKGVTSFSASLLQSLGGDTAKAADVADMAFRDMSDNANKMGTDMQSIQNAYQGFAKQNYTMLDNLKLGYGGTKTEMQRLLADAEKLSGVHYDISNLSDVYNAIHVIQEELQITNATADEAKTTISGSANAMKAAFDNFLNGSGSPEQLATAVTTFIENISKAIVKLAPSILQGIVKLLEKVVPQVGKLLFDIMPQLLSSITEMINKLLELLTNNKTALEKAIGTLVNDIVKFITNNLPTIIQIGITLLLALASGIANNLDTIVPALIECIMQIVNIFIENIDLIIETGVQVVVALGVGIIKSLPQIIKGIFNAFVNLIENTNWGSLGTQVLKGILNGMLNFGNIVKDTIKKVGNKITSQIKSFFGIKSPSRLMRDEVGEQLTAGIAMGFEKGIPETIRDVNAAMKELNGGIQSSLNPTINPTANSNPLIIQIENFNNTRQQDVQALAEELEFYRKNSALARGGN